MVVAPEGNLTLKERKDGPTDSDSRILGDRIRGPLGI